MRQDMFFLLSVALVPLLVSGMMIFDFSSKDDANGWQIVNDGVMGGLSRSEFIATGDSTAVFRGVLSLENYGGFASVRSVTGRYDMSGHKGIELRVLGDGRKYQIRLRTDSRYDGVAYTYEFDTEKDKWLTVKAPFSEFLPTFRGRIVEGYTALDPGGVRQVGFLIGDKVEGPFRLEIDSIAAYPAASPE